MKNSSVFIRRLPSSKRRGVLLAEAFVAAALVVVILSVAVPSVIRCARIWKDARHHQLAADVLSGEMDRLIGMEPGDRNQAIEQLSLDRAITDVLVDATLVGNIAASSEGKRIELSLDWNRLGDPPPLTLVAWLNPVAGKLTGNSADTGAKE